MTKVPFTPLTKKQLNAIMKKELKKELSKKNPDMKKVRAIRKLMF